MSWKDMKEALGEEPKFDLTIPKPGTALTPADAARVVADNLPMITSREAIMKFQEYIATLPQVPLQAQHRFAEGVYMRILPRPAGTVIVGKRHRKSHIFLVHTGRVTALTDQGVIDIEAPYAETMAAGLKKIVVSHTDAVIMTVHENPNNWGEADLDKLEAELIIPDDSVVSEQ